MIFICARYPKLQMTMKTEVIRELNGVVMKEPMKILQFQDNGSGIGEYETDKEDEIEFVKKHSDFGIKIFIKETPRKSDEEEIEAINTDKIRPRMM